MSATPSNVRVFLSRDSKQAAKFTEPLKNEPCEIFSVPVIETELWKREENVQFLNRLNEYDWLFFTSAKGVRFFYETITWLGYGSIDLSDKKIAAVGTGTAAEIEKKGLTVHFIPSTFDAEHMGEEFLEVDIPKKVLLIKGELSRTIIDEKFERQQFSFENMYVYRTVINYSAQKQLNELYEEQPFDYYVFTSPSSIHAFFTLLEQTPKEIYEKSCFCIGATTQEKALQTGFTKTYVPEKYTLRGLSKRVKQVLEEESK
ncbi:uroporphyrinogen-III synthase [Allobacillus sp. GCM10007491]|uniref:Uroporphyrinogen-III synthase n=1 Tax=Allobacillus saliphilus TaxID=2912308 RepID=A0A941CVG2_9BACI|nr:uroporphyrinogen-III synthase [Allobacillus saliphilus]MBR7553430.1 uroporphyrinogen-III synthase [Allobacillus saliphilus]